MQASMEEQLNSDQELLYSEAAMKLSDDFYAQLKLSDSEEEDEEEFSFVCEVANDSQITAGDAFIDGQIKPVFPLFNRDLLFPDEDEKILRENLPIRPPVKKVFVERKDGSTSTSSEKDDISGPCCELKTRKVVEASPEEVCKKSNSTGFSKIWRLKDFKARCNSDGRDAFVFLNNNHTPPSTAEPAAASGGEKKESTKKANGYGKAKKSKTSPLSAHEVYLKNKAKMDDRQKSYLPYRRELLGVFTNVNGGLTRSVHPF
ncbi:Hypothetical predicted protein [Olea europaea subsp. europaea]|uniref:Uncharacterized protein n=1 Tax=Olea europaea subsp. europaea TaxID=158383 RepID=A0A8S0RIX4_OLEEU|nr:Hypothetical predicted protein [Olea europaea subsp. europaea]